MGWKTPSGRRMRKNVMNVEPPQQSDRVYDLEERRLDYVVRIIRRSKFNVEREGRCHSLRYKFATNLMESGVDILISL